ncbi:glycosyltransferase [Candidatus Saccharibacteria bacterium]|nr:glycosyltransferase [Candidatus Saccharibacteria bacterium]MBR3144246.1 glycosyltransferase [Candidatus Saccharibacteria bacterium]
MKNILIISDGFLYGGFETRTLKELVEAKKHHYNIFLACIDYNQEENAFKQVLILKHPLSDYNDFIEIKDILATRDQIIDFCKKNRIDLIECHPYWCLLPATLAAEKLHIPTTCTLHGVTSGNFITPSPANIGLRTLYYLVFKYGFNQIIAVAEYLCKQYSYLSSNITITRNGINLTQKTRPRYSPRNGYFCIASRLDIPKTKLIEDFLPTLHALPEVYHIDIFGDGDQLGSLKSFIDQNRFNKISIKGWHKNLPQVFIDNHYTAIFGMGQVALEAFSSNTPVGILGYGGFAGLINKTKNLSYFMKNNFTDWKTYNIDLKKELQELKKNPNNYLLSYQEISKFDQSNIWNSHFKTEESLAHSEKPILNVLNHLLENHSNKDIDLKKFFSESDFPDTQSDTIYQLFLENIKNGLKANQVDKLKQSNVSKTAEINALKKEINDITNSGFWKTTKPLRKLLNKLH